LFFVGGGVDVVVLVFLVVLGVFVVGWFLGCGVGCVCDGVGYDWCVGY